MKYLATIVLAFLLTDALSQKAIENDVSIFYALINEHFKKNKANCYLNINIEPSQNNAKAFTSKICGNLRAIDTNLISIKHASFLEEYSDSLIPFHTIHSIHTTPTGDLFRLVISSDANVVGIRCAFVYKRKNKYKLVKSAALSHWDRI